MNENEIIALLDEIDSTHFRAFWYDSPLLARCRQTKDSRAVRALALRHHALENKEAGSCHVLRQTIKNMEGPPFPTLWHLFDTDREKPEDGISDPFSERWAAGFILGEIGGYSALQNFSERLGEDHRHLHYAVVRCASHIIGRYFAILDEDEPTVGMLDVKTGKQETRPQKDFDVELYRRTMNDRKLANEYFVLPEASFLHQLKARLSDIEPNLFNVEKDKLIMYIDHLPTR